MPNMLTESSAETGPGTEEARRPTIVPGPVAAQQRVLSALLASREDAADRVAHLTPRQRQIMEVVLAGHPSKNIAVDLGISQRTVENHRHAIMKKTGSKSIPALARVALAAAWNRADEPFVEPLAKVALAAAWNGAAGSLVQRKPTVVASHAQSGWQPAALGMKTAKKLRELASWYREFAERAGNPSIWDSRLRTADDLDNEAEHIEHHSRKPTAPAPDLSRHGSSGSQKKTHG
jgi:DNA-binding CsgD family transcriptional regulator